MQLVEMGHPKIEGVSYRQRECCYGICLKDGKVLVVYSEKDKNYSVPGGGMESGESLYAALEREMREEAGYELISSKHFLDIHTYGKNTVGVYIEKLAHMFLIEVDEKTSKRPIEDWHKPMFVEKEKAIELIDNDWQKRVLKEYL